MMTNQKLTMCSVSESKRLYYTQKTERLAVGCLNGCSHTESWSHVKGALEIVNPKNQHQSEQHQQEKNMANYCNIKVQFITFKKWWSRCTNALSFLLINVIQWTLVIVNSGLSPILFTNERFSLLPESMIFSFITYNWYRMLYLTIYLLYKLLMYTMKSII